MKYTRLQMLNQLIIAEYQYISEPKWQAEHPEHTQDSFIREYKTHYMDMADETLEHTHTERVGGYHEDGQDIAELLQGDAWAFNDPAITPYLLDNPNHFVPNDPRLKAYAVILFKNGNTTITLTDNESFDWITSNQTGKTDKSDNTRAWFDKSCPETVRQRIWDNCRELLGETTNDDFDTFYPFVTLSNIYANRASYAPPLTLDGERLQYTQMTDFIKAIQTLDVNVVDAFDVTA